MEANSGQIDVKIRRVFHRDKFRLGLFFPFSNALKQEAKTLGATYSKTHHCWYLEDKNETIEKIKHAFKDKAWLDYREINGLLSPSEEKHFKIAYKARISNYKMPQAVDAMMDLMTNMPEAEEQFNAAKEATLKKIAAQRITKSNIFWTYEGLKKRGIDNDNREDMYNTIKDMTIGDLREFFNNNIKGETYNVMVIGNKDDIDFKALQKLGKVQNMDIDYLFNYAKPEEIKL